jgi:hypothetical protein
MQTNLNGFARVNARNPRAFGICDTCGYQFNLCELVDQVEYQGNNITKTGFLVCTRTCNDKPQPQLRSPILPNDPVPMKNPRVETYAGPQGFGLANSGDPASSATPAGGEP